MLLRKSAILMVIMAVLVSMVPMAFAQDGGDENVAHLIVAHTVADAPPVDVYAGAVSGAPIVKGLAAGTESEKLDLATGTYNLIVVLAGTSSPVLAEGEVDLSVAHSTTKVSIGGSVAELPLTLTAELVEEMTEATPEGTEAELKSIAEIALGDENFSTLVTAVMAADPAVLEAVSGEGPLTIFAPPNSAFEALPPGVLDAVLASPPSLQAILMSHVIEGKVTLADLAAKDGEVLTTLFMGVTLTVKVETVEGADAPSISLLVMGDEANAVKLAGTEVEASNGNVIVIESVIVPPRPGGAPDGGEGTEATPEGSTEGTTLGTIADVAAARNDLTTLVAAGGFVGLTDLLIGEGPLTVFAPNDETFNANTAAVDTLLSDLELAANTLKYHVVPGLYTAETLAGMDGQTLVSAEGTELTVTVVEGEVFVNGLKVTEADIMADNGVLHIIDGILLLPTTAPDASTEGTEATPEGATEATLEPTVEPTTEPTAEPTAEPTTEPTAEPTTEPTAEPTTEGATEGTEATPEGSTEGTEGTALGTIADVAAARNDLTTLVAAGGFVGLTDLLIGEGPLTVFAPNDETFNANTEAVDLLLSDLELAANTLKYHVVPGLYTAETLAGMDGQTLVSAEGTELTVTVVEGEVFVNGLKVTEADIMADNGVLHIIDGILLLPDTMPAGEGETTETELKSIVETVSANENLTTLVSAVLAADPAVLEAINGEGPFTVFAPTNEAFEALPEGVLQAVLASPPSLQAILLSHVVAQDLTLEQLLEMDGEVLETAFPGITLTVKVETLEGEEAPSIFLLVMGDEANMVKLGAEEFAATNGHIILIESVIVPPQPEGTESAPAEATPAN